MTNQALQTAWAALKEIAVDFDDYPAPEHKALGDRPWFDMAMVQGDIARKALAEIDAALAAEGWTCAARKQALPEPADCNWPVCGCDPHADKVIEALEEMGVRMIEHAPTPPRGEVEEPEVHFAKAWADYTRNPRTTNASEHVCRHFYEAGLSARRGGAS